MSTAAPQQGQQQGQEGQRSNGETFRVVNKDHIFTYPNIIAGALSRVITSYATGNPDILYNAVVALYRAMLPRWTSHVADPTDLYNELKEMSKRSVKHGLIGKNSEEKRRLLRTNDADIKRAVAEITYEKIMSLPEFQEILWRQKQVQTGGGGLDI